MKGAIERLRELIYLCKQISTPQDETLLEDLSLGCQTYEYKCCILRRKELEGDNRRLEGAEESLRGG